MELANVVSINKMYDEKAIAQLVYKISFSFHQRVTKTYTLAIAVIIFFALADQGWQNWKGENRNQVELEELLAPGHATI